MKMIKLHYALYDPAVSTGGSYWTWASPEIQPLLDRFHGDIATKHLPPKPNDLQENDLWSGLVRLANWVAVYRYFNGGWDKQGRPGRYILLTAWIPSTNAEKVDLLPIMSNETFQFVAKNAEDIPVPQPITLQESWTAENIATVPFQEGEMPYPTLQQAIKAFVSIPSNRRARYEIAHLKIIKTTKEQRFILNVVPEPKLVQPKPFVKTPITRLQPQETKSNNMPRLSAAPALLSLIVLLIVACIIMTLLSPELFKRWKSEPQPETPTQNIPPSSMPIIEPQLPSMEQLNQFKNWYQSLSAEDQRAIRRELQDFFDDILKEEGKILQNRKLSPSTPEYYTPPPPMLEQ